MTSLSLFSFLVIQLLLYSHARADDCDMFHIILTPLPSGEQVSLKTSGDFYFSDYRYVKMEVFYHNWWKYSVYLVSKSGSKILNSWKDQGYGYESSRTLLLETNTSLFFYFACLCSVFTFLCLTAYDTIIVSADTTVNWKNTTCFGRVSSEFLIMNQTPKTCIF